jgi:hypothetical protein
MKVYIITAGYEYEKSYIIAIYNKKETAEKELKKYEAVNEYQYDWYEVEGYEVIENDNT